MFNKNSSLAVTVLFFTVLTLNLRAQPSFLDDPPTFFGDYAVCGDGFVSDTEECDLGKGNNIGDGSKTGCDANCKVAKTGWECQVGEDKVAFQKQWLESVYLDLAQFSEQLAQGMIPGYDQNKCMQGGTTLDERKKCEKYRLDLEKFVAINKSVPIACYGVKQFKQPGGGSYGPLTSAPEIYQVNCLIP